MRNQFFVSALLVCAVFLLMPSASALFAQPHAPLGGRDFRISHVGGTGNPDFDASTAAVVYNPAAREYLVVWHANDPDTPGLAEDELEIFGQRIDAATGALIGAVFRISDAGGTGDPVPFAVNPSVVYNALANEYLVVWQGNDPDTPGGLGEGEVEVFGQRLTGDSGAEIGANDFRISDASSPESQTFDAFLPAVAYNALANEYLVVWTAVDPATAGILPGEQEIYGQRLSTAGAEVGANDFRISDAGGIGNDAELDTAFPAVVHNPVNNEYLVVWHAEEAMAGKFEIYGQRLSASGAERGVNDFRISDSGDEGEDPASGAIFPALAHNAAGNEYLVVWYANDTDTPGIVAGEQEIFGQRLAGDSGAEIGANDFRISDVGGTGNAGLRAFNPQVVYNTVDSEYLVVWTADDPGTAPIVDNEFETFGQRLAASGAEIGVNDFRISDAGGTESAAFDAFLPAVAHNAAANEYLVVWQADDTDTPGIADEEFEIFGRRFSTALSLGFAQFGNGGGLRSEVVLTNPNPARTVTGEVAFLNADGSGLDLQGRLLVTPGVDDTQEIPGFAIAPLGSVRLATDGEGPLSQGSVSITANGAVGGVIRFEIAGIGVAGVGVGVPFTKALAPVQRAGSINTGIAVRAAGADRQAVVQMTLRDLEGNAVPGGAASVTLDPGERIASFIDELFPDADTNGFQGTVTLESANPIIALALELGAQGQLTTLPVTVLEDAP